ncbi:MAG: UDP-3-O-(3-hydroxymyristoyl)glucosamine N-acyltransferase [Bacteroidota bacterium]|nr:UDP-3-O-(3-hydroxymyristoyl)glucosamine N-acyltransferase [Bacteroidota bacterium]
MRISISEIIKIINGEPNNKKDIIITELSKIEDAKEGSLSFLANLKYKDYIYSTNASAVIVKNDFKTKKKVKPILIYVEDPYSSFTQILDIAQSKNKKIGISDQAIINKETKIAKDVYIGHFCTIERNVTIESNVNIFPNCYIGENTHVKTGTIIYPGVKIYDDTKIGRNNIIHSGAVIGSDGFGFAPNNSNYEKIAQIGNVIIEDNVEIGANTTIDRATMGSTCIRKGVKLDNQIQIAHNVEINRNTVIAAQTAIAGSTKIGKNCMIGGQVAIAGHLKIGDNVKIAGHSGVGSNLEKNAIVQGQFAFEKSEFQRSYIIFKRLPEIYKTLQKIKDKFNIK